MVGKTISFGPFESGGLGLLGWVVSAAGVQCQYAVRIAPDRAWYFYPCWRVLSDLYAVDGLK